MHPTAPKPDALTTELSRPGSVTGYLGTEENRRLLQILVIVIISVQLDANVFKLTVHTT